MHLESSGVLPGLSKGLGQGLTAPEAERVSFMLGGTVYFSKCSPAASLKPHPTMTIPHRVTGGQPPPPPLRQQLIGRAAAMNVRLRKTHFMWGSVVARTFAFSTSTAKATSNSQLDNPDRLRTPSFRDLCACVPLSLCACRCLPYWLHQGCSRFFPEALSGCRAAAEGDARCTVGNLAKETRLVKVL